MLHWAIDRWRCFAKPRIFAGQLLRRREAMTAEITRLLDRKAKLKEDHHITIVKAAEDAAAEKSKLVSILDDLLECQQKNRELEGEIDVLKVEREGMIKVNEALISRFDSMIATNVRLRVDAESKDDFHKTDPV